MFHEFLCRHCRDIVYIAFISVLSLFVMTGLTNRCSCTSQENNDPYHHVFQLVCLSVCFSFQPQKERKAGGLLKLLSGAAAKKKPRSPPSSPPNHNPSLVGQDPAHHPHHHHHHARSGSCPMASHGRAGSCPVESEMAGAIGLEPLHRKSGSLDTNFPLSPPATRAGNPLMVLRPEPKPLSRERWAQTYTHTQIDRETRAHLHTQKYFHKFGNLLKCKCILTAQTAGNFSVMYFFRQPTIIILTEKM